MLIYTPKHGSWLNIAEIEFSILGRECLDRRIPDKTALINEINAWTEERNSKESKIIWRFKNEDARIKLKRLYPLIKKYLIKIDDLLDWHLIVIEILKYVMLSRREREGKPSIDYIGLAIEIVNDLC